MQQRKSKKAFIYFFLLILLGSINNTNIGKLSNLNIENINISGLGSKDNKILLNAIEELNLVNLISLDRNLIKETIETNPVIENYKIFKKYPSTIEIQIEKTKYLAKINIDGKIFIIGANGKLLKNQPNENLPYIFGKPEIEEFLKIKTIIDDSRILYSDIKMNSLNTTIK